MAIATNLKIGYFCHLVKSCQASFELKLDNQVPPGKVASMCQHALPSAGDLKSYMEAESFYDV
jgi:hypothetical protein